MDFKYKCAEGFKVSAGYHTFVARWKKEGRELQVLVPETKKPTSTFECTLKVELKDAVVYVPRSGEMQAVSSELYKKWMDKVQYDPEHGKETPAIPRSEAPAGPRAEAMPTLPK